MTKERYSVLIALFALLVLYPVKSTAQNIPPIADAGLSRYAAHDTVVLDGTGSYDPDGSGPLTYAWRQIAGPAIVITDANTATPTIGGSMVPTSGRDPTPKIGGFIQTDEIQECEFELVVSDGELTSLPDTVKVIIVPDFSSTSTLTPLIERNPPFDPNKPTIVGFHGGYGNCQHGAPWLFSWFSSNASLWYEKANVITFDDYYIHLFQDYGDMLIVYLSSQAPDYKQPIQTMGWSAGGQPAIDVGIHLNLTYADSRYAVNRVTSLDATRGCRDYSESISTFLASSVDGEQCWVDNYGNRWIRFHPSVLNVASSLSHSGVPAWYVNSLTGSDMNQFNNGVVAGAYWSVVGPGKNLQLASTPNAQTYKFRWYGDQSSGYMDFYDEAKHPGRLPEPVTLLAYSDALYPSDKPTGALLTCKESENAVGYQLLFGSEPYRVMDYNIISDTPTPPAEIITNFPFEQTWWTVKARDQYGSTIYADPIRVNLENLPLLQIENLTNGKRYGYIQLAINDANSGDVVVVEPGVYQENIFFRGRNLMLRSIDPNDPNIVAATVIDGGDQGSVVTFSGGEDANCVLAGFTVTGGTVGISCRDASPTIRNCTIGSNGPIAIEFWEGYEPIIIDCTILGQIKEYDPMAIAHWKLDEAEGFIAYDSIGDNDGTVHGNPLWQPTGGQVGGALQLDGVDDYVGTEFVLNPADGPFSVFAWIKGGAPGQAVISQTSNADGVNWLCADTLEGNLMTELRHSGGRVVGPPLWSQTVITDGDWHRVGFV